MVGDVGAVGTVGASTSLTAGTTMARTVGDKAGRRDRRDPGTKASRPWRRRDEGGGVDGAARRAGEAGRPGR